MGLTIHYSFRARGSEARARRLVHALHQTAQDLPFKELGEVVELSGEQCDANKRGQDDPLHWLLIQAEEDVEIVARRYTRDGRTYRAYQRVRPTRLIAFTAWPGEGCEESNFGLGQYPAEVQSPDGPLKTRLSGWRFGSFCNNVECSIMWSLTLKRAPAPQFPLGSTSHYLAVDFSQRFQPGD